MRVCRIDAKTGKLISETIIDEKIPGTEKNLQNEMNVLNMPAVLPDVMSCDGKYVYMRSQQFDLNGKRTEVSAHKDPSLQIGEGLHMFSPIGFLDGSWFHRSYWLYGKRITSGCNYWFFAGRYAPSGRIMVFDDETIYAHGRLPKYFVWTPALEYRLYAGEKNITREDIERVKKGHKKNSKTVRRWIFNREVTGKLSVEEGSASQVKWSHDKPPFITRAMVLAGKILFAAGPPDLLDEEEAVVKHFDPDVEKNIKAQDDALNDKKGALLWAVSAESGKKIKEIKLESMPVWDGMIAANGKLFISTADGKVRCYR